LDPNFDADYKDLSEVKDKFDLILLIEVIEHIANPKELLTRLSGYLKKDGQIWISVPFAARIHPYPQDFYRFTEDGLKELCEDFTIMELKRRGNNLATISTKINYLLFRTLRGRYFWWTILLAPGALILLIWSIISLDDDKLDDDPLGFFLKIKCKK
jgi:SAM-dependent methyltransferase